MARKQINELDTITAASIVDTGLFWIGGDDMTTSQSWKINIAELASLLSVAAQDRTFAVAWTSHGITVAAQSEMLPLAVYYDPALTPGSQIVLTDGTSRTPQFNAYIVSVTDVDTVRLLYASDGASLEYSLNPIVTPGREYWANAVGVPTTTQSNVRMFQATRSGRITLHPHAYFEPISEDYYFTDYEIVPAAVWTINHNRGQFPDDVAITDSAGNQVFGSVEHTSVNQTVITFDNPAAGRANLEFSSS